MNHLLNGNSDDCFRDGRSIYIQYSYTYTIGEVGTRSKLHHFLQSKSFPLYKNIAKVINCLCFVFRWIVSIILTEASVYLFSFRVFFFFNDLLKLPTLVFQVQGKSLWHSATVSLAREHKELRPGGKALCLGILGLTHRAVPWGYRQA